MTEQLELPVQWRTDFISGLVITPAWYGLRQQVKHMAQFGGSAQVVHGPRGAGKTTFLLFLQEDQEWDLFAVDALPKRSFEVLLGNILDVLDCPRPQGGSVGEGLAELRRYVQQLERDQARAVLAIDNADQLEDAAIAALVSVLQGGQDLGFGLHWLFVSRPGLAERIDRLQLFDIEVSDVALPNFSPSEMQTLLAEAKKHRRLPGTAKIDQVQSIWAQASGWPGPALAIAAHTEAANDKRKAESSRRVWPVSHIAALAILLTVLVWAVLVRDRDISTSNNAQAPSEREVQVLVLPGSAGSDPATRGLPLQAMAVGATAAATEAEAKPADPALGAGSGALTDGGESLADPVDSVAGLADETGVNFDRDQQAGQSASSQTVSLRATDRQDADLNTGEDTPAAPGSVPTGIDLPDDAQATAEAPAAEAVGQEDPAVPGEPNAPEEPAATAAPAATAETQTPELPANAPTAAEPGSDPDREVVAEDDAPAPAQRQVLTAGEAHLLDLPADGYVLQLMAIGSLAKMQAFVAAQPNRGQLHIYPALRNGQQLYILVEGFYDSRRAAQAGIANLPAAQRRGGPWPKSAGQIQQEIKRLRGL